MDELDAHYEGQVAAAEGDKAAVAQWVVDQAGLGVGDLAARHRTPAVPDLANTVQSTLATGPRPH